METTFQTDLKIRMQKTIESLREEVTGLRTGRASTALLDHIQVEVYGSRMPLNQVASLSVPEPRLIVIQPWDKGTANIIAKAIRDSDLGLNPIVDGPIIRAPLPDLTEQRRKELVKLLHRYGEQAKVSVRNIRREAMEQTKKQEKSKEISKDDQHVQEKMIQDMTDKSIAEVDKIVTQKEVDILQV